MQHGKDVVEQVLHVRPHPFEVTFGLVRDVGTAPKFIPVGIHISSAEPGGEPVGDPFNQMIGRYFVREGGLRFGLAFPDSMRRGQPQVSRKHMFLVISALFV